MAAEKIKPDPITKPTSKYAPKNATKTIITLATNTDASAEEIAKTANVSTQAVYQTLERHGIRFKRLESYKNHRADILAGIQTKILKHIDEDRLKKASAFQLVGSLGLLYDKERIERGLSNGDQPIMVIIRDKPQPVQVEGKVVDIPKVEQDSLLISPET